jgi:hypothetical protein
MRNFGQWNDGLIMCAGSEAITVFISTIWKPLLHNINQIEDPAQLGVTLSELTYE